MKLPNWKWKYKIKHTRFLPLFNSYIFAELLYELFNGHGQFACSVYIVKFVFVVNSDVENAAHNLYCNILPISNCICVASVHFVF